jgi:LacI family transcriptional regulator, galactose operon repressor
VPSTIRDVARLAGVSVATVSAVINGKGRVSSERSERVRKAIEKLDYHPDHTARSLRTKRTLTVGVIVPQFASPFFAEALRGVEDVTRSEGYSVLVCNSSADPIREQRHLSTLLSGRVDGILLASADPHFAYHWLARRQPPLVLFDRVPAGFRGTAVTTANVEAATEATNHLIGLGHKGIGIIAGPADISSSNERLEGFRKAMGEAGLPIVEEYFKCGDYEAQGGYRCALELLQLPHPPTAIFSCNYEMTMGLERALSELHVRCPEQVSILAYDDLVGGLDGFSWATMFSPKLTAVAQPSYELGRIAAQLLIEKMLAPEKNLEETRSRIIRLKAELRMRESTAAPHA